MADPKTPPSSDAAAPEPIEQTFEEEVETQHALEQGLGIGARELASIHESGAEGTLERAADEEEGEPAEEEAEVEVGDTGRSANVLDRKAD